MTFLTHWQSQLSTTYTEFARRAAAAPEVEAGPGLIGAAILWPTRRAIQEFDGEALDAVRSICGTEAKHIFKAMQNWGDDSLTAARDLAAQTQANPSLAEALNKLSQHFQVAGPFAEALAQALVTKQGGGDVYSIARQIKAALVNIGGTTNIQSLTIQLNMASAVPPKLVIPPLPYEPETILIPAGSFVMGSNNGELYEGPAHTVTLSDYKIGKYPVTNRQYVEFIRKTGRLVAPETGWAGQHPLPDKLDHPVMGVTWYDVLAYCQWLSKQTGRNYILPSEAQWEKAARGPHGFIYPWGNEWQVQHCHHGSPGTLPVDAYPPQNEYGCYDLVGNVREWTRSLWGQQRQTPDPTYLYPWPADGQEDGRNDLSVRPDVYRVYRGGAALDEPAQLRCYARNGYLPNKAGPRQKRHGFRVVQEI